MRAHWLKRFCSLCGVDSISELFIQYFDFIKLGWVDSETGQVDCGYSVQLDSSEAFHHDGDNLVVEDFTRLEVEFSDRMVDVRWWFFEPEEHFESRRLSENEKPRYKNAYEHVHGVGYPCRDRKRHKGR